MTTLARAKNVDQPADPNARYKELAAIVRREGWFDKGPPIRILCELAFHVVLFAGGLIVIVLIDNIAVRVAAMLVTTAGGLGIVTSAHSASHNSSTDSLHLNRALVLFGFTFINGLPASFWRYKHIVTHHPNPNVIGVDNDIDTMPYFAINARDVRNSTGFQRAYFTYVQGFVIPFAIVLNSFNTLQVSWRYLFSALADSQRNCPADWMDLGVLFLHWTAWLVVPMLYFDPVNVFGLYSLRIAFMGYAAFITFAPAHFPDEAVFSDVSQQDLRDFLLRQTATTVNFRAGPLGRVFCAGVDYQIEHHLFPNIPHTHYPALAPVVMQFCEQHGYPYRTLGWGEAVIKSLRVFFRPKPVYQDLSTVRVLTNLAGRESLERAP